MGQMSNMKLDGGFDTRRKGCSKKLNARKIA